MAKYILRIPSIPDPPLDKERLTEYVRRDMIPAIVQSVLDHLHVLPDSLSGELRGRTYTEATKPPAADAGPAALILSSDAVDKPQMSDGTVWIPLGGGSGSPGPAGPAGPPGVDGATGEDGGPGPPGPTGSAGTTGAAGPSGPATFLAAEATEGEMGPPGPPGATGATGSAGATGPTGPPGPAIFLLGDPGEEGMIGPPGPPGSAGGGGGAPTDADYLVGTANAGLSNEIVVGATPGGQLGGTWGSPDVRGLRESFGPTLLTMGIVTDGSFFTRSGSNIIGSTNPRPNWTLFEVDLGTSRRSGTFDLSTSGQTADKVVCVMQTTKAISSKGDARDEAEFDQIQATGYVVDATTIRIHWWAPNVVVGTYAMAYFVSN